MRNPRASRLWYFNWRILRTARTRRAHHAPVGLLETIFRYHSRALSSENEATHVWITAPARGAVMSIFAQLTDEIAASPSLVVGASYGSRSFLSDLAFFRVRCKRDEEARRLYINDASPLTRASHADALSCHFESVRREIPEIYDRLYPRCWCFAGVIIVFSIILHDAFFATIFFCILKTCI